MIKCNSCGKPAPIRTEIRETGVVTKYRLATNPTHGHNLPHLVRTSIEYTCENGHCAEWTCECGQVNDIAADLHTYRISNLR